MKKLMFTYSIRFLAFCMLIMNSLAGQAQDKVEIDTQQAVSWFERNWIWVVAGVVLIIILAALGRSRNRTTMTGGKRKTTTVVEDEAGNIRGVTTTEENL